MGFLANKNTGGTIRVSRYTRESGNILYVDQSGHLWDEDYNGQALRALGRDAVGGAADYDDTGDPSSGGGGGTFTGGDITGATDVKVPDADGVPLEIYQQAGPTEYPFLIHADPGELINTEGRWFMAHPEGGLCLSSAKEPNWAILHVYKYAAGQTKDLIRVTDELAAGPHNLFVVDKDGCLTISPDPDQSNTRPLTIKDHALAELFVVSQAGKSYGPAARGAEEQALGIVGQTASFVTPMNYTGAFTGEVRCTAVALKENDVVNKVGLLHNGGANTTLFRVGIYDVNGTLMASSTDKSATVNGESAGYHEYALSATWTVPATGIYYIGWIAVGTTGVSAADIGNTQGTNLAGGHPPAFRMTGQTDLPDPITKGFGTLAYYGTLVP